MNFLDWYFNKEIDLLPREQEVKWGRVAITAQAQNTYNEQVEKLH